MAAFGEEQPLRRDCPGGDRAEACSARGRPLPARSLGSDATSDAFACWIGGRTGAVSALMFESPRPESGLKRWVLWEGRLHTVRGGGVGIVPDRHHPRGKGVKRVSRSEEGALVWRALPHHVRHVDPSAGALRDRAPTSGALRRGCWARQAGLTRGSA